MTILPPSKGGTGRRLNAAIKILKDILYCSIIERGIIIFWLKNVGDGEGEILWMRIKSNILAKAIITFVAGPAAETKAESRLGFLKLWKFTGTGFAVPKINAPFENIKSIIGTMIVPMGSMCAIGFSVSLPIIFAVGSPNLFATKPWATS